MKNADVLQSLPNKNVIGSSESKFKNPSIYVFKTNVLEHDDAQIITRTLLTCFPGSENSFDLGDCDKVLRIKHYGNFAAEAINILSRYGFDCEELLD